MIFVPVKSIFHGEFEYDKIKFIWNQDNHSFSNWNRIFNGQKKLCQNSVLKSDSKTEFQGDSEYNNIKFIWNQDNHSFLIYINKKKIAHINIYTHINNFVELMII